MQPKEHVYKAIGEMVVAFQALEKTIERVIFSSMTSSHTQVSIFLSEMSFKAKINVMSSLLHSLHNDKEEVFSVGNIYQTLDDLKKRCIQCESRRNQLIHSFYVPGFKSSPNLVMRIKDSAKSKTGYKCSVEIIDSNSLDETIRFINSTEEDLNQFCHHLCNQFKRFHGILGLENCADYETLLKTISQSALQNGKIIS